MQIRILKCEQKTAKSGVTYKRVTIEDEIGTRAEGVSVFNFFPDYENVVEGGTVEGMVDRSEYNGKPSYKLVESRNAASPTTPSTSYRKPAANSPKAIAEAQERKAEQIEKAQDRTAEHVSEAQGRNESMWAKYGACELVANHPAFQNLTSTEIDQKIHELASFIVNDQLDPI